MSQHRPERPIMVTEGGKYVVRYKGVYVGSKDTRREADSLFRKTIRQWEAEQRAKQDRVPSVSF